MPSLGKISQFIFSSIYIFGCLAGLCYQVYLVSDVYFGYKVTTEVTVTYPDRHYPQAICLCVKYPDIIDNEKLKRTGKELVYDVETDRKALPTAGEELTVEEIFDYTPKETEILKSVLFRKNMAYRLFTLNGPEIYNHFKVEKFVYLEYVCYKVFKSDTSDQHMSYSSLAVTPISPGLVYHIVLEKNMWNTSTLRIANTNRETIPYRPLMVTSLVKRKFHRVVIEYEQVETTKESNSTEQTNSTKEEEPKKTKTSEVKIVTYDNVFTVYQVKTTVHNLPPPFTTKCRDYGEEMTGWSRAACIEDCMKNEILNSTGRMPFTYILTGPIPAPLVNYRDVSTNDTWAAELFRVETFCIKKECRQPNCIEHRNLTRLSIRENMDDDEPFSIQQVVTQEPWIDINARPAMNTVEYVTYVTSLVTTYLGFSALSLEPISMFLKVKNYLSERDKKEQKKKAKNPNNRRTTRPNCSKATHFVSDFDFTTKLLKEKVKRLEKTYKDIWNDLCDVLTEGDPHL